MKHSTSAWEKLATFAMVVALVTVPGLVWAQDAATAGAVFVSTNSRTDNQVWQYTRATDGTLTLLGKFSTTGLGNAGILGSQGSVILGPGNKFLFVVNAGSNNISSFSVKSTGLTFVSKVASGGTKPVSLTAHGNFVYVTNAAGTPNIVGFKVSLTGVLTQLASSSRNLSATGASPGQVGFNSSGTLLVVTEKGTNKIDTFTVATSGLATGPLVQASFGKEPFGFNFDNKGHLIVSETPGSAMTSYSVNSTGTLTVISGSVPDFGSAACWVVNTNNSGLASQYSYTTNTGSNTISRYQIGTNGSITLQSPDAPTAVDPLDMALSTGSVYLYAQDGRAGEIEGFSIGSDGSLTKITAATAIPITAVGLAAY